jgi:hypothetical protein
MKTALLASFLAAGAFTGTAFAETWTGTIVDEHCGAKHMNATEADQDCVKKCIEGGAKAGFLTGGKVYRIANQVKVKGHEGQKVKITGKIKGNTLIVEDVGI